MLTLRIILIFLVFSQPACSQENEKPVLLLNPTVHTGSDEVYENAALAFESGKITLLADARLIRLDMSAFEVVEAYGLHVYPAAVVEELPEDARQASYFTPLDDNTFLITARKAGVDLPVQVLQQGADATFVVTEDTLDEHEPSIRYLVIKGRLKRENNVSLQPVAGDQ